MIENAVTFHLYFRITIKYPNLQDRQSIFLPLKLTLKVKDMIGDMFLKTHNEDVTESKLVA